MDALNSTHDKIRAILVVIATAAMIAFNVLAGIGYVNGVTPDVISAKYPTALTPAGYAFSIWSLIYLGLTAFSIFQLLPRNHERFRRVRTLYIASCVLNCSWIYFFHHDQIGVCLAIIVALWLTLLLIMSRLAGCASVAETWLMQAPFGVYSGWVTAASFVNLMVFLKYLGMPAADSPALASVLILFAALFALVVRWKLSNFFFPLAVAWALTAIAIGQSGSTAIVLSAAIGVVVCLVTTGSFVVNLRGTHE